MEQYISKSALVAEIERIKHETNYEPFTYEVLGKRFVCRSLLSFLDTLEVKEVEEVEKRTQHHISMEDIEKAAARYDGSMDCVGCFIGGAKWMEQRLKDK